MFYYYNGNVTYLYCDYCCFYQKFLGAESPVNLLLHICFLFFESLPSRWPSGSRAINLCLICATKTIWSVGTRICFYQPNQGPCLCNLCVIRPIMFGNQSETVSEEEMIYLVVMPNHRDGRVSIICGQWRLLWPVSNYHTHCPCSAARYWSSHNPPKRRQIWNHGQ